MTTLRITHNAGFFSCCTIRLSKIVDFFNKHKSLPTKVDSSEQFINYKSNFDEDLSKYFFKENDQTEIKYIKDIKITNTYDENQFSNYHFLNLKMISPFIERYFKLSNDVLDIIDILEKKYEINHDNTISVFYRSNDKITETNIGSYETFYQKINECSLKNPNMKILIQTDDQDFLDYCVSKLSNIKIIFFDEIPMINNNPTRVIHNIINKNELKTFASYFLAATKILSKSKILITHSGNCGMWAIFFRGNMENVYQYLNQLNNKNPNKIFWQLNNKNPNKIFWQWLKHNTLIIWRWTKIKQLVKKIWRWTKIK